MVESTPVCLTIAGSDCSGGAGIQADLKTFARLGVYGTSAVTAVVAETPRRVVRITALSPERVVEQAALVLEDFPVAAVKSGMLGSAALVTALGRWWAGLDPRRRPPLIIDPVLAATTGDSLMERKGIRALVEEWIPQADLITPNLDEIRALLSAERPKERWAERGGPELAAAAYARWKIPCLVTGGDAGGRWSIDTLVDQAGSQNFRARRVEGGPFHGTGCTLSAAITAQRARGGDTRSAIRLAKGYVGRCLRNARRYRKMNCPNHGA